MAKKKPKIKKEIEPVDMIDSIVEVDKYKLYLRIESRFDRDRMCSILAHAGVCVHVEETKGKHYVCLEVKSKED